MTYWKDGAIDQPSPAKGRRKKSMPRPTGAHLAPDWWDKGLNVHTGYKVPGVYAKGKYYGEWGILLNDDYT